MIINQKQNIIIPSHTNNALNVKNFNNNIIGSFVIKEREKDNFKIIRDLSGSRKIFMGKKNKQQFFSSNFIDLKNFGCKLNSIKSFERGTVTKINFKGKLISKKYIKQKEVIKFNKGFHKKIETKISLFLKEIKKKYGNSCYVCLSGGLDSTLIAFFAKKIFKNVVLLTAYEKDKGKKSSDLKHASQVARKLKLKHIKIPFNLKKQLKDLKKIMYASQDWRDYNIHCAFLNFAIAKYIDKKLKKLPVLTGDMMNEFFADYDSEIFKGETFYNIPNVEKKIRQRFFIRSLDSSDREIGIFNFFRIPLFQPYSVVVSDYESIPKKIINKKKSKYIINGKFIPNSLLKLVLKKKNRAKITDDGGGILSFFLKNMINQKKLNSLFKAYFKIDQKFLRKFINIGSYRHF